MKKLANFIQSKKSNSIINRHRALKQEISDTLVRAAIQRQHLITFLPDDYELNIHEYCLTGRKLILSSLFGILMAYGAMGVWYITSLVKSGCQLAMSDIIQSIALLATGILLSMAVIIVTHRVLTGARLLFCTKRGLEKAQDSLEELNTWLEKCEADFNNTLEDYRKFFCWKLFLNENLPPATLRLKSRELGEWFEWVFELSFPIPSDEDEQVLQKVCFKLKRYEFFCRFVKGLCIINDIPEEKFNALYEQISQWD